MRWTRKLWTDDSVLINFLQSKAFSKAFSKGQTQRCSFIVIARSDTGVWTKRTLQTPQ